MRIHFLLRPFFICFCVSTAHGIYDPSSLSDGEGEGVSQGRLFHQSESFSLSELDDLLLGNMFFAEGAELNEQEENIRSVLDAVNFLAERQQEQEREISELQRKYTEIRESLDTWERGLQGFFAALSNRNGTIERRFIRSLDLLKNSIEAIRHQAMALFREACEIFPNMFSPSEEDLDTL